MNDMILWQKQHEEWARRNFGDTHNLKNSVLGACEEVGELAHAVLKRDQSIRGTDDEHTEAIKDACADIIIYLFGVANSEGFILHDVLQEVWGKVMMRDWQSARATNGGQLSMELDT